MDWEVDRIALGRTATDSFGHDVQSTLIAFLDQSVLFRLAFAMEKIYLANALGLCDRDCPVEPAAIFSQA